jgi:hypothetical protein
VLDDPQRRWTKFAAAVIGIPICLLMQDLKPEPTGALLVVIAVLSGATWKQSSGGSTLLRRVILAAAVWLSVTIVAYTVLVRLYPPVDEAGIASCRRGRSPRRSAPPRSPRSPRSPRCTGRCAPTRARSPSASLTASTRGTLTMATRLRTG